MHKLSITLGLVFWMTALLGQSPHGKSFSTDCSVCHKTSGWKIDREGMRFDHDTTPFKLIGQHRSLTCKSCHQSLEFSKARQECRDCHSDLHEGTLGPDCSRCHSPRSWIVENITQIHEASRFPLTQAHQITNCADCHKSGSMRRFDPLSIECVNCHRANYLATKSPNHVQLNFSTTCADCHTTSVNWKPAKYPEHDAGLFPVYSGKHSGTWTLCADCHKQPGNYALFTCVNCHALDKSHMDDSHREVNGYQYNSQACFTCHPQGTTEEGIDHGKTNFKLTGAHAAVDCIKCHSKGYAGTPTECSSCHQVQYDNARDHKQREYPLDCKSCHNSDDWKAVTFDHAQSRFPLTGAHLPVSCTACHANGYTGVSMACNSCHAKEYSAAQNPNHTAAGIPILCETCHNTTAWKPGTFNHSTTGFPLTAGHSRFVQCSDCHKGTVLNTKTDCIICHQAQYDGARDHKTQAFPTDCKICHNPDTWANPTYNHSTTRFPLTGAHTTTECAKCHINGYTGLAIDCNSCHAGNFTASVNPGHVAAGIPILCETCHNTNAWKPGTFNHATTGFPLTAGHTKIAQCSDCHKGSVVTTQNTCIACHQAQYDGALNHKTQGYPTYCKICHNANNWLNATFNHSTTGFPLTGVHTSTACAKCHTNGYTGTRTDCNFCHTAKFTSAVNPNHVAAGIPVLCETCHNTTAWKPGTFNHATTGFPLTAGHSRYVQCSDCHKGTVLNTKTDCIICHQAQYDGAKDHKTQAFPTDCKICHNPDTWANANFNHSRTIFPLTGVHTTTLCAKCHVSGYTGTRTDCNFCHTAKFTAVVSPNHVAAGIPVLCETCHNTTAWKPGTFNHTTSGFALTGAHSTIAQCSSCHKGSVVTTQSTCISCHQVQYDGALNHKTQSYPTDCKMCHNANNWQNPTFNHSSTSFPLTGVHTTTACAKCHTSGYAGTRTDCNFCHAAKFTAAVSPNHVAAGIPVLCETCHNTTAWKPGTFNHTTTGFALTGGHTTIAQCSSCHKGSVVTTQSTCISCHQTQYDGALNHKTQSYPTDCKMCHNANNWQNPTFNHSSTSFPLTGVHTTTACAKCHTSGYTGTKTDCNFCHTAKFTTAVSPNHVAAGIPVLCENCHNTTAWKPGTFNHTTTGFALSGGHTTIAQCSDCHKGSVVTTQTTCISCHQVQYDGALNHKTQTYPTDCLSCHNANNWLNPAFNHSSTSFPLTGAYTSVACATCHTSGYAGTRTDCNFCHAAKFTAAVSPNHVAAGIPVLCETCHNTTAWKPGTFNHTTTGFALTGGHTAVTQCSSCHKGSVVTTQTTCISCHQVQYDWALNHKTQTYPTDCLSCHNANNWLNPAFNHSSTSFPLTGAHTSVACATCHTSGYAGTRTDCNFCHAAKFTAAVSPNHVAAGIPVLCETCHNTTAWKPGTFNHTTTGFALTGGHTTIAQCSDCHKGSVVTTQSTCISCHQVQYDGALNHKTQSYPTDCKMCHNVNNWQNPAFNHSSTSFPLTGAHTTTACAKCHTSGYTGTKPDCNSCHAAKFTAAVSPNHVAAGIPVLCENCHNTTAWKPGTFNHTTTGFALSGGHTTIAQCSSCHKGTVLNTRTDCQACHQAQYDGALNHKTQAYPTECLTCHNTNNWLNASFNHSATSFPLTGAHTTTLCASCHTSGYAGTRTDCNFCHAAKFTAAVSPNHVAAGIPVLCETCHNTIAWKPGTFNHTTTGFALTGGHTTIAQCSDCHKGSVVTTQTTCISCHQVQYDGALNHKTQTYPTDCLSCHNANNWLNPAFNHSSTSFPLTGAHTSVACATCHTSGYAGTRTDCNFCHAAKFTAAVSPNHVAAGIPVLCETCHNTTAWKPGTFNHTTTGFALTGGHTTITQCSSCHKGSVVTTPTTCISCHQTQYDGALNHKTQAYPTECLTCHNSNNWLNATFNHSATSFPLTGAHTTVACASCHTSGYAGTRTDCNFCHAAKFTAAVSPNHVAAGIPVLCETCHNTTAWKPGTFNHTTTGFALTGGHTTIAQCSSCHKGSVVTTQSTCIACHQTQYDGALNHKTQAYPTDCLSCHNANNWLNPAFNHSSTSFPLTGAHTSVACASCHTSGYAGTRTDCNFCHAAKFTAAVSPNHLAAGIPVLCETCHNTTAWKPGTFNHTTTGFALTGGHTTIAQCSDCHKGSVVTTQSTCILCHQTQYDGALNHKTQTYPTDCLSCHNANNWLNPAFNHSSTSFPLTGAHTSVACATCHTSGYAGTRTDCNFCHAAKFTAAVTPNHVAAGIPILCETCHNTTAWKPGTFNHTTTGFALTGGHTTIAQCSSCHKGTVLNTRTDCLACHQTQYDGALNHKTQAYPTECLTCHNTNNWLNAAFNHSATSFPLTGAHTSTACASCHTSGYAGTRTDCNFCHAAKFTAAVSPNHVAAGIPILCETCHNTTAWKPGTFNHTTTGFALTGGHTAVTQCSSCHKGTVLNTKTDCNSCHTANFTASVNPGHVAAGLPVLCETCHNTTAWKPGTFNHTTTGFALTGGHTTIAQCSDCHKGSVVTTQTTCISCHQTQYDGALNHKTQAYPTDCLSCHNANNWLNPAFNHSSTSFPLTGAHTTTACASCHTSGYAGTRTDCNFCHAAKFTAAVSPNHVAAGIPVLCETCHNTIAWKPGTFNHTTTGFALTGGHTTIAQCSSCHKGTVLNTRTDCLACHQTQYDGALNHKTQAYPTECLTCHNTNNWLNAAFNHSATSFPLTGVHTTTLCAKCHINGYVGTRTDCSFCHTAKFTSAVSPNHVAAGIPVLCETCHNTIAWKPGTFNHTTTGFALTGGHTTVTQCSSCHKGILLTAQTTCISCHQVQYDGALNHKAQGYPTDCNICHNSTNWLNPSFNHSTTTFPLTGVHTATLCASCHKTGYNPIPTTCVSCHQADYNATISPNHRTLALSVTCNDCHTTNAGWTPATFAVHNSYWLISGAHTAIATNCVLCHKGNYTTTPNTCYGCHAAKYTATTNPNHVSAKFPTNCESCHTVSNWTTSTWNHDSQYFPINSGRHSSAWTVCTECHTTPTNYAVFNCLLCHQHSNKASVDGDHQGRSGYSYTSAACYSCHPRGNT